MKKSIGRIGTLFLQVVYTFCLVSSLCFVCTMDGATRSEQIRVQSEKWQVVYGDVDFTQDALFGRMIRIRPQLKERFTVFNGEVISPGLVHDRRKWNGIFFKGAMLESLRTSEPVGYYVNEGRSEPGLLFFSGTVDGVRYAIQENSNGVMMSIFLKKKNGVYSGREISRFVFDNINVKESNVKKLRDSLHIRAHTAVGKTFSRKRQDAVYHMKSWLHGLFGFAGKDAVHFLLFKVQDKKWHNRMRIRSDFDWLSRGLFRSDRKTLVDTDMRSKQNGVISYDMQVLLNLRNDVRVFMQKLGSVMDVAQPRHQLLVTFRDGSQMHLECGSGLEDVDIRIANRKIMASPFVRGIISLEWALLYGESFESSVTSEIELKAVTSTNYSYTLFHKVDSLGQVLGCQIKALNIWTMNHLLSEMSSMLGIGSDELFRKMSDGVYTLRLRSEKTFSVRASN